MREMTDHIGMKGGRLHRSCLAGAAIPSFGGRAESRDGGGRADTACPSFRRHECSYCHVGPNPDGGECAHRLLGTSIG